MSKKKAAAAFAVLLVGGGIALVLANKKKTAAAAPVEPSQASGGGKPPQAIPADYRPDEEDDEDVVEVDVPDATGSPVGPTVPVKVPDVGPATPSGPVKPPDHAPNLPVEGGPDTVTPGWVDAGQNPTNVNTGIVPPVVKPPQATGAELPDDNDGVTATGGGPAVIPTPGPVDDEDDDELPAPTELADVETEPSLDPNGTVGLARILIARETAPDWREDLQEDVSEWQAKVGLKPDGKFGLESAAKMAEEVGVLPLVRFWTLGKHWDKWSALDGKDGYKKRMERVISEVLEPLKPQSAAHINALRASIKREQAQGIFPKPKPVQSLQQVNDIMKELENASEMEAVELIRKEALANS